MQRCQTFLQHISSSALSDPVLLFPHGDKEGRDQYTHLIVVGEGPSGSHFDIPGMYKVQALYITGENPIVSSRISYGLEMISCVLHKIYKN